MNAQELEKEATDVFNMIIDFLKSDTEYDDGQRETKRKSADGAFT